MNAIYEPLSGMVRAGRELVAYGQPYKWAASVRWIDHETAEVLGLQTDTENPKGPTKEEWLAVLECLKERGAMTVLYRQYRDGQLIRTRKRKV